MSPPAAKRSSGLILAWAALGAYGLAILEIVVMSTPFAAYYYTVTSPLLRVAVESPYLVWLSDFFITHLSEPDVLVLRLSKKVASWVALIGFVGFGLHFVYLYWVKLARRAVATRLLYAWVRHPQYGCWIVAGAGLAVMWPRFGNGLLWVLMAVAYYVLARHEERQMERLHGASYRKAIAGKAMFLPGDRRLADWLRSLSRLKKSLACAAALAALSACVLCLRAWSVSRLEVRQPPGFPDILVVAMNPPPEADLRSLAATAAQKTRALPPIEAQADLLYLIWGKERLRHFLIDGGIDRDVFERVALPDASVFLVTASVCRPGDGAPVHYLDALNWARTLRVQRRLRSVFFAAAGIEERTAGLEWFEVPLPSDAAYAHASLPIL